MSGKRWIVDAGQVNGKRLPQACHDARVHGTLAGNRALERRRCGVERGLAADEAYKGACGHGPGGAAFDDISCPGVLGGNCGEKLIELIVVAQLE